MTLVGRWSHSELSASLIFPGSARVQLMKNVDFGIDALSTGNEVSIPDLTPRCSVPLASRIR
jgi:hypothetical protein